MTRGGHGTQPPTVTPEPIETWRQRVPLPHSASLTHASTSDPAHAARGMQLARSHGPGTPSARNPSSVRQHTTSRPLSIAVQSAVSLQDSIPE